MRSTSTTTSVLVFLAACSAFDPRLLRDDGGPAPIAEAGKDSTAVVGTIVQLRAEGDGVPQVGATYEWVLLSRPFLSFAVIANPFSHEATLTIDAEGPFVVALNVDNGHGERAIDVVIIEGTSDVDEHPGPIDRPPVAIVGDDRVVAPGTTVILDGSRSYDPEGKPLAYGWTSISTPGAPVVLSRPFSGTTTFVANEPGDYVFALIVNDRLADSRPDYIVITANAAPTPRLFAPSQVVVGDLVSLDAEASTDLEAEPLTYTWQFVQRPPSSTSILMSGATPGTKAFRPDIAGTYGVQLTVSDGVNTVARSTSILARSYGELRPTASTPNTMIVLPASVVQLDASHSTNPLGGSLTYEWTLMSAPATSGNAGWSSTEEKPIYTADVSGYHVVQLVVRNALLQSYPVTTTIHANTPPVAVAGPDATVIAGTNVALNGSASSDADNNVLFYSWSVLSSPASSTAGISSATNAAASFKPYAGGTYVIQLRVSDVATATLDTLTLTVLVPPIALAGPDRSAAIGTPVALDATTSTGTAPLSFQWTLLSAPPGSTATVVAPDQPITSFTPDLIGVYRVRLGVTDLVSLTSFDDVEVTVVPGLDLNCTSDAMPSWPTIAFSQRVASNFEPLCDGWTLTFDKNSNKVRLENLLTGAIGMTAQLSARASGLVLDRQTNAAYANLAPATFIERIDLSSGAVTSLPLQREARAMATAENDKLVIIELAAPSTFNYRVTVVDGATGTSLASTPAIDSSISRLAYSSVNDQVFVSSTGSVRRFAMDPSVGTIAASPEQMLSTSNGPEIALSVDGTRIATSGTSTEDRSASNLATLYGVVSGTLPVYSPDGTYLAIASTSGVIRVYSVATHVEAVSYSSLCPPGSFFTSFSRIRFSRGGRAIVAGYICGSNEFLKWISFEPGVRHGGPARSPIGKPDRRARSKSPIE
ncbi:MAG: hypothetical protein IT381_10195 [Deltaproteobacteria bacterium]|nr:hypothetical protein [Deltaproteobacteria bacterium]